jgi:hypothetical protein
MLNLKNEAPSDTSTYSWVELKPVTWTIWLDLWGLGRVVFGWSRVSYMLLLTLARRYNQTVLVSWS